MNISKIMKRLFLCLVSSVVFFTTTAPLRAQTPLFGDALRDILPTKENRAACEFLPNMRTAPLFLGADNNIQVKHPMAVAQASKDTPQLASQIDTYFILTYKAPEHDNLLSITSSIGGDVVFARRNNDTGDIATEPFKPIDMKQMTTLSYRGAQRYLRIQNLENKFPVHSSFSLILHFEKAGDIYIPFSVSTQEEYDIALSPQANRACGAMPKGAPLPKSFGVPGSFLKGAL